MNDLLRLEHQTPDPERTTGPRTPSPEGMNVIACDVPKNRQGRVGELALSFEGMYQHWQESTASLQAKKAGSSRQYTDDF